MIKYVLIIAALLFGFAFVTQAAPTTSFFRTLLPETTNTYDLGSASKVWNNAYIKDITISGTCTGCGAGTISTSTALVNGQVVFSTGVNTVGNDSTFLFDSTLDKLTVTNASTTAITTDTIFTNLLRAQTSAGTVVQASNATPVSILGVDNTANSLFYGGVNIDGATRLATSLTGFLKASSGAVTAASSIVPGDISLTKGNFLVGNDAGIAQATSTIFISSTGNVGIATSSPGSKLGVTGTFLADVGLEQAFGVDSSGVVTLPHALATGFSYLRAPTGRGFRFQSGSTTLVDFPSSLSSAINLNYARLQIGDSSGAGTSIYFNSIGASDLNLRAGDGSAARTADVIVSVKDNQQVARFTDTMQFGVGTTSPWGQISASSTSAYPALAIEQKSTGPAAVLLGGNVGVGNAAPTRKLDVTGTFAVSGSSFFTGGDIFHNGGNHFFYTTGGKMVIYNDRILGFGGAAGTQTISTGWNSADSTYRISSGTDLTTTPWVTVKSGNVGIGATDPTAKLVIRGGSLATAGSGLSISSNLATGRLTTGQVGSIHTFADNESVEISAGSSQPTGFAIDGQTTTLGSTIRATTGGSERLRITSTGNVGIGTTTPGYKLDVAGTARVNPTGGVTMALGHTGTGRFLTEFLNGSGGYIGSDSYATDFKFIPAGAGGSAGLYVGSNGDIGVGTTTDLGEIQIAKNSLYTNADGDAGIHILSNTGESALALGADDTNNLAFIQSVQSGVSYTTRPLSLNPNGGNVGIGTVSPGTLFDVNGVSTFRDTIFLSTQGLLSFSSDLGNGEGGTILGAVASKGVLLRGGASGTGVFINSSNNVGIGTASPGAYKLNVNGDVYFNTGVLDLGTGGHRISYVDSNLSISNGTTGTISLLTGGTARMTVLTGGNIGIGTTSPMSTLAVAGTITADNINATSTSSTSKFSGILQVITRFIGVIGAAFTPTTEGEIGIDTTSNQFKFFSNGSARVLGDGNFYPSFTYATSTAWTATTTIPLGPAYVGETWNGVKCFTDTGTLNVSFYDGTNRMNMFNASTTVGTIGLTTNNTFTADEKRYVDVGTPASSPTKISCTVSKSLTAD